MKITFKKVYDTVEFIGKLVVLIGFPIAIIQYSSATKKERRDREYQVYNSLDERFIDWEKLCLAYPNLDIADIPDSTAPVLTPKERKEEIILFTILFSLFERAYILYSKESSKMKQDQWSGWDEYINNYVSRYNFRRAWSISGTTFEAGFQTYMEQKMKGQSY